MEPSNQDDQLLWKPVTLKISYSWTTSYNIKPVTTKNQLLLKLVWPTVHYVRFPPCFLLEVEQAGQGVLQLCFYFFEKVPHWRWINIPTNLVKSRKPGRVVKCGKPVKSATPAISTFCRNFIKLCVVLPCLSVRHHNQTSHLGNKWHSAIRVVNRQDDLSVVDHRRQWDALDRFISHRSHCVSPPQELFGHSKYRLDMTASAWGMQHLGDGGSISNFCICYVILVAETFLQLSLTPGRVFQKYKYQQAMSKNDD